jgi:hypothetical protein
MGSAHHIPEQPSISTVIFLASRQARRKLLGPEKRLISHVSPGRLTAGVAVYSVPSAKHETCLALADALFFRVGQETRLRPGLMLSLVSLFARHRGRPSYSM